MSSTPDDPRNSALELLDRLQASAAVLESLKRKRVPPTIVKGEPELYHGRWFVEVFIHDWDEFRIEIFQDVYERGVRAKVAARVEELLR